MKTLTSIRVGLWALRISSILIAVLVVDGTSGAKEPVKAHGFRVVELSPDAMRAPIVQKDFADKQSFKRAKLASQFVEVLQTRAAKGNWAAKADSVGITVSAKDNSVLAEIRLNPRYSKAVQGFLATEGARIRNVVVPSLMNVWVPIGSLNNIANNPDVLSIRMARRVMHHAVTSEGVAASNADIFQAAGFDGTGVNFANVDGGYSGFDAAQSSSDWPGTIDKYVISGSVVTLCSSISGNPCRTFDDWTSHGTGTVEINYDMAPGATFSAYRTVLVSDMYYAFKHAADNGADVISCSMGAPVDGVGDGTVCPPGWGDPCGTIAEAAKYARDAGVFIANSAGNSRIAHWGNTWNDNGSGELDWGGAYTHDWINALGPEGGDETLSVYCIYDGETIFVEMSWSDWDDVLEDLDLYLYQYLKGDPSTWVEVASSTYLQDGSAGASPQELITYEAKNLDPNSVCGSGRSVYAIAVKEAYHHEDVDISIFAAPAGLWVVNHDHSLGFPADSPHVFTCGAIDVGDGESHEYYSSEGPILSPGGFIHSGTPSHDKPDGVSFARVSTQAYGPGGFLGTSASAPHVAGIAALLKGLHPYATPDELEAEMHAIGLTGANDLGSAGFDYQFGYGRITLDARGPCKKTMSALTPNQWTMIGLPCEVRTWNQVDHMFNNDGLGTLDSNWDIFERDEATGFYSRMGLTDTVRPGKGVWVLADSAGVITVEGINPDTSRNFAIPLIGGDGNGQPNLVGHPFSFDVDWQDVLVYYGGTEHSMAAAIADNMINATMWKDWNGSQYTVYNHPAGQLNEFDGFWVKAKADVELRIPYTESFAASLSMPTEVTMKSTLVGNDFPTSLMSLDTAPTSVTDEWRINLNARAAELRADAQLGQLNGSVDEHDNFDVELMRPFGAETIAVVFPHPEWGEYADDYVRDMRSITQSRPMYSFDHEWNFEVRTTGGLSEVTLQWTGPAQVLRGSVLIDVATGKKIQLNRRSNTYTFNVVDGVRKFIFRDIRMSWREKPLLRP